MAKYQIGWFSTGRGPGSRGLLTAAYDTIKNGGLDAEITFVFCSRELGEAEGSDQFISLVENYKIPLVCFSYQKFKAKQPPSTDAFPSWRLDYDREVMARLQGFSPDLCVLAGYMLITGPEMCQRYNMINLHPAAPWGPKGTWQKVIWQLIDENATETGVMMHLATPELDMGPVVTYCTFSIRGKPFDKYWEQLATASKNDPLYKEAKESLFNTIREQGVIRELPLVIATIKAFSEGKVKITPDKKVIDDAGKPIKGYNLTEEIDRLVSKG